MAAAFVALPFLLGLLCSSYANPAWLWAANILERGFALLLPDPQPTIRNAAVAIVTLGYSTFEDGSPTPLLAARVATAVRLSASRRPTLVFSGGVGRLRNVSEASAMLNFAQQCLNLPISRHVLLENRSHSTRENAVESLRLLRHRYHAATRLDLHVVTNAFHRPRACRVFTVAVAEAQQEQQARQRGRRRRTQSVRVHCAGSAPPLPEPSAPSSSSGPAAWCKERAVPADPRERVYLALREVPALLLYWYRGWL